MLLFGNRKSGNIGFYALFYFDTTLGLIFLRLDADTEVAKNLTSNLEKGEH